MILRWDLLIIITTTLLWKTCLCDHECSITFSNSTEMVLTCLSNMTYEELPLYNYTTNQLANITSIVVNGLNGSLSGPFTSIPPNICLLPNLKSIDLSNNQIRTVDPADSFRTCFTNVTDLDVSYNNITNFPSPMIYNMQNLQNLDFQHNQLTDVPGYAFQNISNMETLDFSYNSLTTFELWALLVMKTADFRHNQISMITNKYFYQMPNITSIGIKEIFLGDNPSTNLTDAVYEMYNACGEVYDFLLAEDNNNLYIPSLTYNLAFVNFGTVQIDCSCQQSYILQMLGTIAPASNDSIQFPIANSTCNASNIRFEVSSCPNGRNPVNSSVDFSQIYPRFCKINSNESGSIMSVPSATIPTANVPKYPHYLTEFMNPGACFFAFSDSISVRIRCTIDVSSSSTLPSNASFNEYLSNVTTIDFASKISSLPSYLCSLPSREIDLSYQSFTTLTDATFPCLDWFHTIRMTHNSLTSVNMTSRKFSNLTTLDLSSNQLTGLPHSILTPTPTSLRVLNLSNNSITSIDIFLYTLKNITVDLSNNPINSSSIINPQNVTFSSGNNTNPSVTIIFPSSVTNSTFILNDATALTAGTCNSGAVLDYRNTLLSTYTNVLLDCTCASINLKIIFERNNASILNDFSCANLTSGSTYRNLTFASCGSNALDFSTGLCYNESLQWTTTTTTTTTSTSASTTSVTTTTSSTSTTSATTSTSATSTTSVTTTTTSTATSTTSETTTTSATSTTSESTTTSSTSTSTATSTTSETTTTSSTSTTSESTTSSTSTTSETTTTSSTSSSTTITFTTTTEVTNTSSDLLQFSSNNSGSNTNRTGLIIGLVLGLIAFLALIISLIAVICIVKSRSRSKGKAEGKPVGYTTILSQAPRDNHLQSHIQTRNPRSIGAPLDHSQIPNLSSPSAPYNRSNLYPSMRGIPLRLEPIRPPMNIAAPYATNLYSSTNPSYLVSHSVEKATTTAAVRPSQSNQMINTNGDILC